MGGATDELVHCTVDHGVATITLDSPHNRNALSKRLVHDLHQALDTAERSQARVIVLGHVAPAFCSGADLSERANDKPGGASSDSNGMVHALQRLMESAAPTIAAVDGPVRAGGMGLMASCDLVVVRRDATFAFTEVRIGVAPAIISVPILRRCNWSHLAAPFLTGEVFGADEARSIGLVTHVTDDVSATVAELTAGVLRGAPGAVAATKRLLRHPGEWDDMQHLSETLFRSAEAAEGMRAFAEKRSPSWVTGAGS